MVSDGTQLLFPNGLTLFVTVRQRAIRMLPKQPTDGATLAARVNNNFSKQIRWQPVIAALPASRLGVD